MLVAIIVANCRCVLSFVYSNAAHLGYNMRTGLEETKTDTDYVP